MQCIMEPKGRDSRKQIVMFKKITTFFNFKSCFDVANIIVSYKIFKKTVRTLYQLGEICIINYD